MIPSALAVAIMRRRSPRHQQLYADLHALLDDTFSGCVLFHFAAKPYDAAPTIAAFFRTGVTAIYEQQRPLARLACVPAPPRTQSQPYLDRLRRIADRRPPTWWRSGDRRQELAELAIGIHNDGPANVHTDEAHLRIAGELLAITAERLGELSPMLSWRSQLNVSTARHALVNLSRISGELAEVLRVDPPQPVFATRPLFPGFL